MHSNGLVNLILVFSLRSLSLAFPKEKRESNHLLTNKSTILKHLHHACVLFQNPHQSHTLSSPNFEHCPSIVMVQALVVMVIVLQSKTLPPVLPLLLITIVRS